MSHLRPPSLKGFPESEEHIAEVYDFVEGNPPSKRWARFAHKVVDVVYAPEVSHTNSEKLAEHIDAGGVLIIVSDHKRKRDPFVFAAAMNRDPVLRQLLEPKPNKEYLPEYLGHSK